MKSFKINFSELEVFDINGVKVIKVDDGNGNKSDFLIHKQVANLVYTGAKNLDLVEIARDINSGKEVEVSEKELNEIKDLIINKSNTPAFIKLAISEFIDKAMVTDINASNK